MGRPGAGGSGGRVGGSSHSVSRGGSGHRVGGSSRPTTSRPTMSSSRPTTSSFNSSASRPKPSSYTPPVNTRPTPPPPPPRPSVNINIGTPSYRQAPPPPPRRQAPPPPPPRPPRVVYHNGVYRGNTYNNTTVVQPTFWSYVLAKVISAILVLAVMLIIIAVVAGSGGSKQTSTIQRVKLESGNGYMNDNVLDELGWINNPSRLSSNLKEFYNKTGVVPYIYLKEYDAGLSTDAEKSIWAQDFYDSTFDREDVLLWVYFEDYDPYEIGYMYMVYGLQTGQIMDAEAENIFWNYLDSAWTTYGEGETDEMFEYIFNNTAKTIMKVSTTGKDIVKWIIVAGIVLIIVVGGIVFFVQFAKYKKAKAESDERILKTPIKDLADSAHNPTADLEDKYLH